MMLNRRRRLHHSSRVKLPQIIMSASWFLVSTYLIWISGSTLILSSNQSNATLWVLDTCLTIGLRLLIIILITASLSSKMYNRDSPWEECVLVGTWSTSLHRCSFRCEFVVVPVSSCDDLWSFACRITALNSMSRLVSWDVPNLELPGHVCYGSKSGFATLLVSEQCCSDGRVRSRLEQKMWTFWRLHLERP